MIPVRGTVRMTADLSLVGDWEIALVGMAVVTVPSIWLGVAIARMLVA